jgi:hypothetical protein
VIVVVSGKISKAFSPRSLRVLRLTSFVYSLFIRISMVMRIRYTGAQMARRLLAFALAFVVIGGPLAGDVCEAVCAEHAGHSIDSTVRASHHHHSVQVVGQPSHHHHPDAAAAPATPSAGFMPPPHWCGYLEAIVSESREVARAPIVNGVVTTARVAPLLVHVLPASEIDRRHSPPTLIRSTSPLRI